MDTYTWMVDSAGAKTHAAITCLSWTGLPTAAQPPAGPARPARPNRIAHQAVTPAAPTAFSGNGLPTVACHPQPPPQRARRET
jgi:hypothetical protein